MTIKTQPTVRAPTTGPLMLALREKTTVSLVWRFYMDADQQWRWQHLTVEGAVVSESGTGHAEYESCLADARENGHLFEPAQPKASSAARHYFYAR
jgi:hypothetical protein